VGADGIRGEIIYPPHQDRGRTTKKASEFTLKIEANNLGVMLRRKLDYAFPNQRAEVFISDIGRETLEIRRNLVSGRLEHVRVLEPGKSKRTWGDGACRADV